MRWGSERVDETIKRVLLDSSWVDPPDAVRGERLLGNIAAAADGTDLVDRVREQGTMCLFGRTIAGLVADGHGEVLGERLPLDLVAEECARTASWIDLYYAELAAILNAAKSRGIRPVVLKGPAWQIEFYANTRTRPFKDLDLYVDTDEMAPFGEVLEELGYRQATYDAATRLLVPVAEERNRAALASGRHATPHLKESSVPGQLFRVEAHGPRNDHNFHRIDTSSFYANSRPLTIDGAEGRQLSVVDSLVYACAHIHKNLYVHTPVGQVAMPKLRWFCDVRQMFRVLPGTDVWRGLHDRAAGLGQADAVFQVLEYTERLFPGVVPATLRVPPAALSGTVADVVDDVWRYRAGSSSFEQRLFEPHLDETRYLRLRERGIVGGRVTVPGIGARDEPPALRDWPWETADVQRLSGLTAPDWQYFGTHVSVGVRPKSDEEFSASFALLRAGSVLGVRAEIRDERLWFGQRSGYYHAQDCVQLLFEVPPASRRVCNVLLVPKAADLDHPAALFHYSGSELAGTEPVPGTHVEAAVSGHGYVILAGIPLAALGITEDTNEIGFDFCAYESGEPGQERRIVLQWSGGRNNVRNPSYYGIATIGDA
ncbi:MAG: nucleotidyltransferase family protein [Actinophytocola sp.]|uniref:nucleotidyltransferase family protein n=1 Tax=Actinophytocola sp. TaxID=1872138 RepID=UPI003C772594